MKLQYKEYRNRVAYAQSLNPHQPEEIRARAAAAAAQTIWAAVWHTGDPVEGLAQVPEDGDYLIDVDDYIVDLVTFTHHVSRKAWFDSQNEEVPAATEPAPAP